jgi:hypothetical protein
MVPIWCIARDMSRVVVVFLAPRKGVLSRIIRRHGDPAGLNLSDAHLYVVLSYSESAADRPGRLISKEIKHVSLFRT